MPAPPPLAPRRARAPNPPASKYGAEAESPARRAWTSARYSECASSSFLVVRHVEDHFPVDRWQPAHGTHEQRLRDERVDAARNTLASQRERGERVLGEDPVAAPTCHAKPVLHIAAHLLRLHWFHMEAQAHALIDL